MISLTLQSEETVYSNKNSELKQALSFKDNGDGTITDSTNGLIWQKCSIGQTGEDCQGFIIFGKAKKMNWKDANIECKSLQLTGKKWRLPSKEELETLVDTKNNPKINTEFFPNTASAYWSSTIHEHYSDNAWYVFFSSGDSYFNYKSSKFNVRCILTRP
ncbi:MAG: DUF1566 domain-containing protein [Leptospiraceae bacterium]|nr:DUF1566 domain-containing protein [Leptospiraceae bacterium]